MKASAPLCSHQNDELNSHQIAHPVWNGRMLPGHAVIAAIKLEVRRKSHKVLLRYLIVELASAGQRNRNLLRHAVHRKRANGNKVLFLLHDLAALKGDLRILLNFEEIGRAEVLIASLNTGIDAGRFDRGGYGRLCDSRLIEVEVDTKVREFAPDAGNTVKDGN